MPFRLCFRSAIVALALSLGPCGHIPPPGGGGAAAVPRPAALDACGYIARPVEGVPAGAPWEALPLRKWLAEDRAEPQALAFCAPPECSPGLAVSVVRLKGRDAQITH